MLVAMPQGRWREDLAQGQQQAEQGLLEGREAACRLISQAEVEQAVATSMRLEA
jgi:hypothetical protein